MPSRALEARHAVTRTTESPNRTMTEPLACLASLPVSNVRRLLLMVSSRVVIRELRNQKGTRALLADVETFDEIGVAVRVLGLEVIEQPAAAADQHQQPAPRVVILGVCLEMLGQISDP